MDPAGVVRSCLGDGDSEGSSASATTAWAVDGFATLLRHHGSVASILPQLGVLLGAATVLFAIGTVALRRTLTR